MWEELAQEGNGVACSADEVAQILGSQEVVPPPDYISFLESCGRSMPGYKRGFCLYYPENLEVLKDLLQLRVPAPEGFYFAFHQEVVNESYRFSTLSQRFFYFRQHDDSVYGLLSEQGWESLRVSSDFRNWFATVTSP